jgi:hypothetical protein
MILNFTRFYFDIDEDCRTDYLNGKVLEDIETIKADAFEERLQAEEISYIRVDL